MELTIDQEFKELMPPLAEDELSILTESIINEGCRDPIIIWHGIVIDGCNRYEICRKHGISFKTLGKTFDNKEDAKEWIIRNQLGRRNLPDYEKASLASLFKPTIAEKAKEHEREGGRKKGSQNSVDPPINTQKEVAKLAGVSHDTIHKVEVIEKEGTPEVKESARKGEISVNKAYRRIRNTKRTKLPPSVLKQFDHLKERWISTDYSAKEMFLKYIRKEYGFIDMLACCCPDQVREAYHKLESPESEDLPVAPSTEVA